MSLAPKVCRPELRKDTAQMLREFCAEENYKLNAFIDLAVKEAIARRTKKEVSISSLGQSQ